MVLLDRSGYGKRLVEELNARYAECDELQKVSLHEWMRSDNPSSVNVNIIKRRIGFAKAEVLFLKEHVLNQGLEEEHVRDFWERREG